MSAVAKIPAATAGTPLLYWALIAIVALVLVILAARAVMAWLKVIEERDEIRRLRREEHRRANAANLPGVEVIRHSPKCFTCRHWTWLLADEGECNGRSGLGFGELTHKDFGCEFHSDNKGEKS